MTNLTAEELALQADTDVLGHIRRENALTQARCEAEGITFYGLLSEDIASRYANVYEFERDMAASSYSDFHKDKYGFRPRDWSDLTLREIEVKLEAL